MRFVAMTAVRGAKLEIVFGGQHEQRATEIVEVDEFIATKSHRAKGKRLTTYEVATLRFIEPEVTEDEALEDEDMLGDEAMDDAEALDVEDIMGDDIKAEPGVDYSQRIDDEAILSASQLDLF
jgi:topoisomerase-4 subunit A